MNPQIGSHNLDKQSIPVVTIKPSIEAGTTAKLALQPREQDTAFGLGVLAFINATAVEHFGATSPMPTPDEYWRCTLSLLTTGLWVNKSNPSNWETKLSKYKGGTSTYPSDNHKKVTWFVQDDAERDAPLPNSGNWILPLRVLGLKANLGDNTSRRKVRPLDTKTDKFNTSNRMESGFFSNLTLPPMVRKEAGKLASAGLSTGTKAQYNSALNMAQKMEKQRGVLIGFPWKCETVIQYVVYMRDQGLKASTISNYLAGMRMQHLFQGFHNVNLKDDIIKLLIKGAANLDAVKQRLEGKKTRRPVTWEILMLIRSNIHWSKASKPWKRAAWLTCALAFNGSFRIHEILAKCKGAFSSQSDLLADHVKVKSIQVNGEARKYLQVFLANPKEEKLSEGVQIELFEVKGKQRWLCPVKAYEAYRQTGCMGTGRSPLIRAADGSNYTGRQFNDDIKNLLKDSVDYSMGPITSHSFRAGLATMMAKAGFQDAEIQMTGRWNSEAFKKYVKAPRLRRANQAADLVNRLAILNK